MIRFPSACDRLLAVLPQHGVMTVRRAAFEATLPAVVIGETIVHLVQGGYLQLSNGPPSRIRPESLIALTEQGRAQQAAEGGRGVEGPPRHLYVGPRRRQSSAIHRPSGSPGKGAS